VRARPEEALADWCEAEVQGCTGRATQRHHKLTRSRGGSDDVDNTVDVCGACHGWIHANPRAAEALDLYRRTRVADLGGDAA
jgi:hypothetical protein